MCVCVCVCVSAYVHVHVCGVGGVGGWLGGLVWHNCLAFAHQFEAVYIPSELPQDLREYRSSVTLFVRRNLDGNC